MARPTRPRRRAAIVVAHPDDEVIFFGALAMRLVDDGWDLDVVCVTGSFGSPRMTGARRGEFFRACWALGARARMLSLPDEPGLLDEIALARILAKAVRWEQYARVYTHGPWGEYGHLHHVQVCRATHRCVRTGLCLAGPFRPDVAVPLSRAEMDRKRRLAARAYPSQPFAAEWCADQEDLLRSNPAAIEFLTAIALSVGAGHDAVPQVLPSLAAQKLPVLRPAAVRAGEPVFPGVAQLPVQLWRDGHRARVRALRRWLEHSESR